MTRLMAWVMGSVTAVLLIVGTLFTYARSAQACSMVVPFVVTAEHLADEGFNDADSEMARAYRQWSGDSNATIEVQGVYVYETIYQVGADGDWSAGSVSVPMEMWGQWPADTSPVAIEPEDRSSAPPSTCPWGPSGQPEGTRTYHVVVSTAEFAEIQIDDRQRDVLDAAFGSPDIAVRDQSLEQDLIAQVNSARASSTALFAGLGVAAVAAAGAVMYAARRSGTATRPGER